MLMKRAPHTLTRLLFALLLVIMTLPGVLMFVPATKGKALFGVQEAKIKERSPIMYYLGKHDDIEQWVKQHVGFCNHGVRLYNELNYILFRYSSSPSFMLCRERISILILLIAVSIFSSSCIFIKPKRTLSGILDPEILCLKVV